MYSLVKYLTYNLKSCARYPPAMRYEYDHLIQKTNAAYLEELDGLKEAHPCVSAHEIERGRHTHVLMTGGKFLLHDEPIPAHVLFPTPFAEVHLGLQEAAQRLLGRPETYEDMLWLILKHTSVNRKAWKQDACLTEAISKPYHRFFLKLDLLFVKEHETAEDWTLFVRSVCSSVGKAFMRCYPKMQTTRDATGQFEFSVLCTKGYRAKKLSETVMLYGRGIHTVWPGVIVDRDQAECLARLIDEHLTRDVPRDLQGGENSWKDAIDMSVYLSGLRPAGCLKITPCAVCRSIAQKKVSVGTSYDYSARFLIYQLCHPPNGFQSQGEESVYSLDMISMGDGAALTRSIFKLRLESHVLKDQVTGKEYDFPLKNLTSIRTSLTEPTPGFQPPLHLCAPINRELTDFKVHVEQDPETGDFLPPPKRKNLAPRNAHPLVLSNAQMDTMTRVFHDFHPRYDKIILDTVWAFPTDDVTKILPQDNWEPPKGSLYSHLWFTVEGEGSHYCHNKVGIHASNRIRFHVDYQGNIYQGCWCMKTYNGKACSKMTTKGKPGFVSKIHPFYVADIFTTKNNLRFVLAHGRVFSRSR